MARLTQIEYITPPKIQLTWDNGVKINLRETDVILVGTPIPDVERFVRQHYGFLLSALGL